MLKTKSLSLLLVLATTLNGYATNLLINGTFDSDATQYNTPAGWTLVTGDVHINPANSGPGLVTQSLDLGTSAASELTSPLALMAGQSYLVELDSYDWAGFSDSTVTHQISVDGNVFDILALTKSNFNPQSFSFVSNTTGVVDFSITTINPFFDYNNFLDNISVSAVPEPSVSLLLGGTLIGLLRRRRPATDHRLR